MKPNNLHLLMWQFLCVANIRSEPVFNTSLISDGFGADVASNLYSFMTQPLDRLQNVIRGSILPTYWCGIRNSAPIPEAISAVYPHLDSCCRAHDTCPIHIKRGKCFKGICNPSFLAPILSCDCEFAFKNCLQSLPPPKTLTRLALSGNERLASDIVGTIYFHILPKVLHGTKAELKCLVKVKEPGYFKRNGHTKTFEPETEKWKAYSLKVFDNLKTGWLRSNAYLETFANYFEINDLLGKYNE